MPAPFGAVLNLTFMFVANYAPQRMCCNRSQGLLRCPFERRARTGQRAHPRAQRRSPDPTICQSDQRGNPAPRTTRLKTLIADLSLESLTFVGVPSRREGAI